MCIQCRHLSDRQRGDLLLEYHSPSAGKAFVGREAKLGSQRVFAGADGKKKQPPVEEVESPEGGIGNRCAGRARVPELDGP